MKRSISTLLCLILFVLYSNAQGVFKPVDEKNIVLITDKLKTSTQSVKSLQTDFVQSKTISVLEETIESKGVMYYKSPGSIRWEYLSPNQYIFVVNNQKISVKAGESATKKFDANANRFSKEISDIMLSGINGMEIVESKKFTPVFLSSDKLICIQLTPVKRQMRQMLSQISFFFDINTYAIQSIEMLDGNGDKTQIRFVNKKENIPVDDEKFTIN